ncbi:hypothetical protein S83_071248 [Arachis hypogaea]
MSSKEEFEHRVFTTEIDVKQGKVTVSGNVDLNVLIKNLSKSGKYAELCAAPKPNNNQNQNSHLSNHFNKMQIDTKGGRGGNNNKGQQNQKSGGNNQHPPKIKGFQDLKLPQFKDMKPPPHQNPNAAKAAKFVMPEDEEDFTDNELDDDFDEDDEDYDNGKFDDDMDVLPPPNKMKQPPSPIMMNNGSHPQFMTILV